jgi:hypothetical protein
MQDVQVTVDNTTVTVLDIVRRSVCCLRQCVSETAVGVLLRVGPTQLGPVDRSSLCLRLQVGPTQLYP